MRPASVPPFDPNQASGGIGREIVFAFAEAGAKGIICADIKVDDATRVAEESKVIASSEDFKALSCSLDITKSQSVNALVDFAVKEFGRIDFLVNAAGVSSHHHVSVIAVLIKFTQIDVEALLPFQVTSEDDMNRVMSVNAHGAFIISKAAALVMTAQEPRTLTTKRFGTRSLSRGAIVHIASAMAFGAVPYKTPYITAKHALLGIVRASGKCA